MHYGRRACGIAAAVVALLSLPVHAAFADPPPRPSAPTPDVEMQVARHAARYRVVVAWIAAVEQAQADQRQAARVAAAVEHYSPETRRRPAAPTASSSGRCGGDLPPCYVMQRESGGSLTAQNPHSTASGKWQFLDSTWNGYGGYASASDAPESVQDARARELWDGGAGCSHWSAC